MILKKAISGTMLQLTKEAQGTSTFLFILLCS